MKNLFILLCLALCAVGGYAQVNLVPNPSFEVYDTCPNNVGQLNYCINWNSFNSPDYFNSCAIQSVSPNSSVPKNLLGFQYPSSGKAYAGFSVYSTTNHEYREIISTQLNSPLIIGQKYYVKLNINLTLDYIINAGADRVGLRFSNTLHNDSNPPPINNTADIYSNAIITDTMNWTTIYGSFVADSSYGFVELGNFFDDTNTNVLNIRFESGQNLSYYFLDDICVSTDSDYTYNYVYTGITEQNSPETISIYPNPAQDWITIRGNDIEWLMLYDVLGRTVTTATNLQGPYQMNVASLPRGLYFLSAKTKTQTIYKKIVLN